MPNAVASKWIEDSQDVYTTRVRTEETPLIPGYYVTYRASHGYRLTAVLPVSCLTAVNRLVFISGG